MKRFGTLLLLLSSFLAQAQSSYFNATGNAAKTFSASLGGYSWGMLYNGFTLPILPRDAVIQGIYPVVIASAHYDIAFQFIESGAGAFPGGPGTELVGTPSPGATYSNTEFWGTTATSNPSIGTSLSLLTPQAIFLALNSSLNVNPTHDTISTTGIGFAVFYTSATPTTDPLMPPPFTVPAGQGLAWSVPQTCSIFGPPAGNGNATCTPAGNLSGQKGLQGYLVEPDGTLVNGTMTIQLPRANIRNTCVTPWQVVPNNAIVYKVAGGQIVNGQNLQFISTDCLTPRYPYYISLNDLQSNFIMDSNWYFPKDTTINEDVGNMVTANYGGPITVQVPNGIIGQPTGDQIINQRTGTSLQINGTLVINGVTFATAMGGISFPGIIVQNPSVSQTITQPGGTSFIVNGNTIINGVTISGSLVQSVFGRSGPTITAQSGDYTCAQVTGCPVGAGGTNYQTIQNGGSSLTQRPTLNAATGLVATDNGGSNRTDLSLAPSGISPGSYAFPTSITFDQYGRATAATAGSGSGAFSRSCNSNGCYITFPDGTITQWGTASISVSSDTGTASITFPTAFPTTASSFTMTPTACSNTCSSGQFPVGFAMNGPPTTTGVTGYIYGVVPTGGGGSNLVVTNTFMWQAWGW